MSASYANEKLAIAMRNHLLDVDAVPPTAEASRLARELAQVCLGQLRVAGLSIQTVENLFRFPKVVEAQDVGEPKRRRLTQRRRRSREIQRQG